MKFAEVAENVKQLVESPPVKDEFIYELLLAYGTPKATIVRLKAGAINLSKEPGEVLLKKKVFFKQVGRDRRARRDGQLGDLSLPKDLFAAIEELKAFRKTKTNDPRFLIVVDDCRAGMAESLPAAAGRSATVPALQKQPFNHILAVDRKTGETLDTDFQGLETHFTFFLPWAGMEKTKLSNENPADVKAAEKMAKLFDAIKQDNPDYMRHDAHAMNVFLARLLFCLFAEDTGIFPENAVSNAIASHTAEDGSDLDAFFKELFDWLDTSDAERGVNREGTQKKNVDDASSFVAGERERFLTTEDTEDTEGVGRKKAQNAQNLELELGHEGARKGTKNNQIQVFLNLPYVNGGLFRDHYDIPQFSGKSRRMLIEAGSLTWAEINPDIFGSMFQAVIDPEERHNLGQHYTSVTNIMKVIEPLFLNDFKEELERARNLSQKNVRTKALNDLHDRLAKVKIFDPACGSGNFLIIAYKELRKLEMELFEAMNAFPVSRITVAQFYGIEIDDFACETATLSLWLAEHQMNLEYQKRFKQSLTSLPLKDGAHIVCDNACRIDWEAVCPKNERDEIYVLGNPPYLGGKKLSKKQSEDMDAAGLGKMKQLDYIGCWFIKATNYIYHFPARFAFVTTSSVCQGEQVHLLWSYVFERGLEISFAYEPFAWSNNARNSAGVFCTIVGIKHISSESRKWIFSSAGGRRVKNISPYLIEGDSTFVVPSTTPLNGLPVMCMGSNPVDGTNLILDHSEYQELIEAEPHAAPFLKRYMGGNDFMSGLKRYCIWIEESGIQTAKNISFINKRLDECKKYRRTAGRDAMKVAERPHQFCYRTHKNAPAIIFPNTSSANRKYIPGGFTTESTVINKEAFAIYNAEPFLLGVLSSTMHRTWLATVGGRLGAGFRYSVKLVYNTFPIPDLTEEQKQTITLHVGNVLEGREKHSEKTMAQLYDPDKMPAGLREAHHQLDLAVDRIYRSKPFTSDEERLEHLFKLYEEMTLKEKLI